MMIALGCLIIVASIYLMLKRYDSRLVLIGAGILMAALAGKPMAALDAFAKEMVSGGLITSVCSVMGFALVMKYTTCDKHLICLLAGGLKKVRPLLIPGTTIMTFVINIAQFITVASKLPVGVFSLEMSKQQLVDRMLSAEAQVDGWKLRTGRLSMDEELMLSKPMKSPLHPLSFMKSSIPGICTTLIDTAAFHLILSGTKAFNNCMVHLGSPMKLSSMIRIRIACPAHSILLFLTTISERATGLNRAAT